MSYIDDLFNLKGMFMDLDGLTVFLSSAASGYITRQIIFLDGGWSAK